MQVLRDLTSARQHKITEKQPSGPMNQNIKPIKYKTLRMKAVFTQDNCQQQSRQGQYFKQLQYQIMQVLFIALLAHIAPSQTAISPSHPTKQYPAASPSRPTEQYTAAAQTVAIKQDVVLRWATMHGQMLQQIGLSSSSSTVGEEFSDESRREQPVSFQDRKLQESIAESGESTAPSGQESRNNTSQPNSPAAETNNKPSQPLTPAATPAENSTNPATPTTNPPSQSPISPPNSNPRDPSAANNTKNSAQATNASTSNKSENTTPAEPSSSTTTPLGPASESFSGLILILAIAIPLASITAITVTYITLKNRPKIQQTDCPITSTTQANVETNTTDPQQGMPPIQENVENQPQLAGL